MDYNYWDDRSHELDVNPCEGCRDYQNDECVSNGGCGAVSEKSEFTEFTKTKTE